MIRIALDVPAITRLGLRAQLASRRFNRRVARLRSVLFGSRDAKPVAVVRIASPEIRKSAYIDYNVVQGRFEQLVGVLCFAAQHGVTTGDSGRYSELREWFVANGESIHPIIAPYVRHSGDGVDPMVSMLRPECLDSAINTEGILFRIQQAHEALEAYRSFVEPNNRN